VRSAPERSAERTQNGGVVVVASGSTRVAAVIGTPIAHSLSPVILNAAFEACGLDWVFVPFDVADGDARRAVDGMRALGIAGMSVTMPHKEAVAALVDRLSDDADALGAVNCIVRERDGLVGENTDGPGFVDALRAEIGFDPAGRRCVVIGAGGAARAVVLALGRAGAADVGVVNRTASRAERAAALAGSVGRVIAADEIVDVDLIVNATPVGMLTANLPLDPDRIGSGQVVADLVYHPATTPLLDAARARGATAVNGLGLLVHQAGHSFRRWTGVDPPLSAMRAAAARALLESD
jgi:shikimate dehydrogenase